jgi:hypothetical protein
MTHPLLPAVASQVTRHPPQLLAALVPLLLLALVLDVYCLIDLFRSGPVRYLPKAVWAIIIVFVSAPIGALVYLFVGRDRYNRRRVPGR